MKKKWIFESKEASDAAGDVFATLIRDDLEGDEVLIYDRLLPKVKNPSLDQLKMLACYAYAANAFRAAVDDPDQSAHLRRCMYFARNGLEVFGKPIIVEWADLLLEYKNDWPPMYLFLEESWEVKNGQQD